MVRSVGSPPGSHHPNQRSRRHAATSSNIHLAFHPCREALPRRQHNYPLYQPAKDIPYGSDPIPLAGLASHDIFPSSSNLLFRHSISGSQMPVSRELPKLDAVNAPGRFSSSTICSQGVPSWAEEKSDVRARNATKFISAGSKSPEEAPDICLIVEPSSAEKKQSVWSWKPLRALSHIGRQRVHCMFSAYVYAIESLPPAMNGLRLSVYMRKQESKEGAVQTMPRRVIQGIAEFQEALAVKCTLYSSNASSNTVKFMEKILIVSVMAPDIDELHFGKHQIDLSPLLTDLLSDKGRLEKGNSFGAILGLSGKAKGGKLIITLSCELLDKNSTSYSHGNFRFLPANRPSIHSLYSLPNSAHGTPRMVPAGVHLSDSPTISELGNGHDDLVSMEQLKLDDPAPAVTELPKVGGLQPSKVKGKQTYAVKGFPDIKCTSKFSSVPPQNPFYRSSALEGDFKAVPLFKLSPKLPASLESLNSGIDFSQATEGEVEVSENEAEFEVVDKGMEKDGEVDSSTCMDNSEMMPMDIKKEHLGIEHSFKVDSGDTDEDNYESKHSVTDLSSEADKETDGAVLHLQLDLSPKIIAEASHQAKDLYVEEEAQIKLRYEEKLTTEDEHQMTNESMVEMSKAHAGKMEESVTYETALQPLELVNGTRVEKQHQQMLLEADLGFEHIIDNAVMEQLDHKLVSSESVKENPGANESIDENFKEKSNHEGYMQGIETDASDDADFIAEEFLNLLDMEGPSVDQLSNSEPNSPCAQLLKQFKEEAADLGLDLESPVFFTDNPPHVVTPSSHPTDLPTSSMNSNEFKEYSFREAVDIDVQQENHDLKSKAWAKMLEDAENEALMQEWGLDEKAFASSPPKPTFMQQEIPLPIQGLGTIIPLKNGGILRLVDTADTQSDRSNGKLFMQVSKPLVLPAGLGSDTVDILQNMAAIGVDNMALQVMTALPLEDISGHSVEQVAVEEAIVKNRYALDMVSSTKRDMDEYFSLEELAQVVMLQIETLAVDGLKIQSDINDDGDAPYLLNAFSREDQPGAGDCLLETGMGMKDVTGVHLLPAAKLPAESFGAANGLMDMAITLDEWMLLDARLRDDAVMDKNTKVILAAHQDLILTGNEDKEKKKHHVARRCCMGNTLTIAMLVQLHDPFRNNEAIGAPMMALVQAERIFKPTKQKLGRTMSVKGNSEDEENVSQEESKFKITGISMAGIKALENEKLGWGTDRQHQMGSRWLIANGMSKKYKDFPPLGSKFSTSVKCRSQSLWSISSQTKDSGNKWRDITNTKFHVRNPDIVFNDCGLKVK